MCHFTAVLFHLAADPKITISRGGLTLSEAAQPRFLVMGRGVWDHKSRGYLSTPCLDPRGAPFLLSNNFYNPICGHVCLGSGQCRGVGQTISQIMAPPAVSV